VLIIESIEGMLFIYYENIVFDDLARGLLECLTQHQIPCQLTHTITPDNWMDLYIILGMNDFVSQIVPHHYIVYQMEQTNNPDSGWFTDTYRQHLSKAIEIWDYSLINYQQLRHWGYTQIKYVPLLCMPCLKSIPKIPWGQRPIDVLFYGSINPRRQQILDQLTSNKGLFVVARHHLWNEERSQLISQSKIVINLHYYQHSILETARLSYLLTNGCVVVSEKSQDPLLDKSHSSYVIFSDYLQLAQTCLDLLSNHPEVDHLLTQLENYAQPDHTYQTAIPYNTLTQYQFLWNTSSTQKSASTTSTSESAPMIAPPIVDSHDLMEAEQEITPDHQLILKLPHLTPEQLPCVSIVTVTYNRKAVFPMAIRNWDLFDYPREKLEWVIVDDSDDDSSLSSLLSQDSQIKYYRLQTTGRLSIGQKRNFGVEHATHQYICFMDDDDYYYPVSIYARIALLLKYPQYDLVGVTDLDIYDVVNNFSARVKGAMISEASMGFRRSFWEEQHFPDTFNSLGEGYPFTKNRRHRVIKMPSCFNMIAMTHRSNYTQNARSYDRFHNVAKKDNILKILDTSTRLFINDLFVN